jgi:hypothetical protein
MTRMLQCAAVMALLDDGWEDGKALAANRLPDIPPMDAVCPIPMCAPLS